MTRNQKPGKNSREYIVCYCNEISKDTIEAAIRRGCDSLPKIFDATMAGVGACGGSCRPSIIKMLTSYQQTAAFPADPRSGKRPRKR